MASASTHPIQATADRCGRALLALVFGTTATLLGVGFLAAAVGVLLQRDLAGAWQAWVACTGGLVAAAYGWQRAGWQLRRSAGVAARRRRVPRGFWADAVFRTACGIVSGAFAGPLVVLTVVVWAVALAGLPAVSLRGEEIAIAASYCFLGGALVGGLWFLLDLPWPARR